MLPLLEWLTKRKKPLSRMTRSELRRKELMLEKDRLRLLNRVKKLADEKQDIFAKGADEKTPEVRRVFAQEFELKTTEQLMVSRQLNIRSKEVLTVSRLRMLRENADRAKETGGSLGLISEVDIVRMSTMIEDDAVRSEAYQERLDEMLGAGVESDREGLALSESGRTVMNIWDKMDAGAIADRGEGFDEADRRVREQQRTPEEPM